VLVGGGGAGVLVGGGGTGVLVGGGGSGVGVSGGGASGTGVSVGGTGVGVLTGETGELGPVVGTTIAVVEATGACGNIFIRLGVFVGVGVTFWLTAGPQAKIGTINMINIYGQSNEGFLIAISKSYV
jgi:hypothetical protein